jgi:CheY-like chemotaxis protein
MKKDILLVDDEMDIRTILVEKIEAIFPRQFNFHHASDGGEGIRKIENMSYFLVITDIKMPKYDGETLIEMISNLRESQKPNHILVHSAFDNIPQLKASKKNKIFYLPKPLFGLTKARMNAESGILIDKAIPTIISGNKHTISHMLVGKCLVVKFNTSRGSFTIEAIVKAKD